MRHFSKGMKRMSTRVLLVGLVVLACGCGGSDGSSEPPAATSTAAAAETTTASSSASTPALVGRWKRTNKCSELVAALEHDGLGKIAPSVIGDYFPDVDPKQLAQKDDPCHGAKPIVHYHFFDENGRFGSLDQNEEQVDEGTYKITDDHTFVIPKELPGTTFHFRVAEDALTLSPVVTRGMKREALAHPLDFSDAGWANAVSYPGHEWKQVDCGDWC